jgi:DNA topoisomerase-1
MKPFLWLLLALLLPISSLALNRCEDFLGVSSKRDVSRLLAQKAGLHYSDSHEPGYSRQKDRQGHFVYLTPSGEPLTDASTLSRIASLKIPPAWNQVWIAADPLSHVQAYGVDARGRRQARYHSLWENEVKDVSKYGRMARFGSAIPHLREKVALDLQGSPKDEKTRIAAVVRLLESTGIRIGGEKYAVENQHYGLSTMQIRHTHLVGHESSSTTLYFDFIGKEGRAHRIAVNDEAVVRLVQALVVGKAEDEPVFATTSSAVNKYIKENSASEFSAKDIRTWVGTTTAAKVFIAAGPPLDAVHQAAVEKEAIAAAAERLHNEPATARDNYIDPFLFAAFRSGHLAELAQANAESNAEAIVLKLVLEKDSRTESLPARP